MIKLRRARSDKNTTRQARSPRDKQFPEAGRMMTTQEYVAEYCRLNGLKQPEHFLVQSDEA